MSFFFFKQKTAYEMRISDWSSDVCSSDLVQPVVEGDRVVAEEVLKAGRARYEGQQAVAEELAHAVGGVEVDIVGPADAERHAGIAHVLEVAGAAQGAPAVHAEDRSEERRVGEEWGSTGRCRGSPMYENKKFDKDMGVRLW